MENKGIHLMATFTPADHASHFTAVADWINRHIRALFILPALIFVVAMMVFPIGYTVYLSLTKWSGSLEQGPEPVGLANYTTLLTGDPRFGDAVIRTFVFSV